jgi:hypothetical protein
MDDEGVQRTKFESMGVHEVRHLPDAGRFNTTNERLALKWLAERLED